MGFILMYDITNEDSFNAVQDWATQIKTYSWDSAQGKRHVLRIIYKNWFLSRLKFLPISKGHLLIAEKVKRFES